MDGEQHYKVRYPAGASSFRLDIGGAVVKLFYIQLIITLWHKNYHVHSLICNLSKPGKLKIAEEKIISDRIEGL
jgi:hypothetical protein